MNLALTGSGINLVAASRKRNNDGRTQFDAIAAVTIFYLPFIPYNAFHVFNVQDDHYLCLPLRLSWRLVLRAFLHRWGNGLGLLGSLAVGFAFVDSDLDFMVMSLAIFLLGVACRILWLSLTQKDEKIKDLVGPHAQGSSDPWDWKSDQAETVANTILQEESLPSLVEVARRAIKAGNRSQAMICLRLAVRDPNDFEAKDMMGRMLVE